MDNETRTEELSFKLYSELLNLFNKKFTRGELEFIGKYVYFVDIALTALNNAHQDETDAESL